MLYNYNIGTISPPPMLRNLQKPNLRDVSIDMLDSKMSSTTHMHEQYPDCHISSELSASICHLFLKQTFLTIDKAPSVLGLRRKEMCNLTKCLADL